MKIENQLPENRPRTFQGIKELKRNKEKESISRKEHYQIESSERPTVIHSKQSKPSCLREGGEHTDRGTEQITSKLGLRRTKPDKEVAERSPTQRGHGGQKPYSETRAKGSSGEV